ncbi:flagellar biosynthetic protein FliO [Desulfuromonas sp. CSMB_57]|uniref:flagellar biosynthetic protein FliO n=1 Tax=Desulfuromonas sp. CSMB_57 TaxID=2807629 RepID=UPI0020BE5543|nr:flagellar biosynthetic protein FliO [Desulfuromonas sp. CSMB_57]
MMARCLLLFLLLVPTPARAAVESAGGGTLSAGLRLWGAMLLVLALILLLYAASRRWMKWLPGNREATIRIRETRPLGPRKALCLVEVRGRELLLGVTAERIELLCRLDDSQPGSFDQTLQQHLDLPS